MSTMKDALNRANPGTISDTLRTVQFGDMVRSMPYTLIGQAPAVANPYDVQADTVVVLPDDAKAREATWAYARVGSGTKGKLTHVTADTVGAGEYTETPCGNLVFNASDAWTKVDVHVEPYKGDVYEMTLPVASHILTIPTAYSDRGCLVLLEAESTVGTLVQKLMVTKPASSNSTTATACFSLSKATVLFAAANAVTTARVKILVAPLTDVDALLQADTAIL